MRWWRQWRASCPRPAERPRSTRGRKRDGRAPGHAGPARLLELSSRRRRRTAGCVLVMRPASRVGPLRGRPGPGRRLCASRRDPLEQMLQVGLRLEGLGLAVGQLMIRFGHVAPLSSRPAGRPCTGRLFLFCGRLPSSFVGSVPLIRRKPRRLPVQTVPVWRSSEAAWEPCTAGGTCCGIVRAGSWHEPRNGAAGPALQVDRMMPRRV